MVVARSRDVHLVAQTLQKLGHSTSCDPAHYPARITRLPVGRRASGFVPVAY